MLGIRIGVQKRYSDHVNAGFPEEFKCVVHFLLSNRRVNRSTGRHTLRDRNTERARHERDGRSAKHLVRVGTVGPRYLEDVPKPTRRKKPELGPLSFDERV